MSAMTTDLLTVSLSSNSPAYLLRNTMIEKDIEPSAWAELEDGEYVQAMTQSQWFRTNGLDIPADATEEDILIAMRASRTLHQSDSWVRGDLIEWMRNNKFGGGEIPKEALLTFAQELGVRSYKRLLNNATTAAAWPLDYRYPSHLLTYSHHEELNALPLMDKQAWAERAIAESMSVIALRTTLRDDSVSITQDGEPTSTTVVRFDSDTFDKKDAIKHIAALVIAEIDTGKSVRVSVENVLTRLSKVRLITFPPTAWVEALAAVAGAAVTESEE